MRYKYSFPRIRKDRIHFQLPDHVGHFTDFISEISEIEIADRILKYVDDVLSGKEDEIDFTINAPSVIIRPKISQAYNDFSSHPDEIQEMETEEFRKLLVVWKEKLVEEREEKRRKEDS